MDPDDIAELSALDGATIEWEYLSQTLLSLYLSVTLPDGTPWVILLHHVVYLEMPIRMTNARVRLASAQQVEHVKFEMEVLPRFITEAIARQVLVFNCDQGEFFVWAQKLTVVPVFEEKDAYDQLLRDATTVLEAELGFLVQP